MTKTRLEGTMRIRGGLWCCAAVVLAVACGGKVKDLLEESPVSTGEPAVKKFVKSVPIDDADSYRPNPEALLGMVWIERPKSGTDCAAGARLEKSFTALSSECKPNQPAQPIQLYNDRVDGKAANEIGLSLGEFEFAGELVYETTLEQTVSVNITPDVSCVDQDKLDQIKQLVGGTGENCSAWFTHGVILSTLSTRAFHKWSGKTDIGFSALMYKGEVYSSRDKVQSLPLLSVNVARIRLKNEDLESMDALELIDAERKDVVHLLGGPDAEENHE